MGLLTRNILKARMNRNDDKGGEIAAPQHRPLGSVLKRGISGGVVITAASALFSIATEAALARVLGVSQYGVYAYTVTMVGILVIIARMGFDLALLRFVPAYTAREEWDLLKGILSRSFKLVSASGFAFAILGVLVVWMARQGIDHELTVTILIGMSLVPIVSLINLMQASIRAWKHIVVAQIPLQIMLPSLVVTAVFILASATSGNVKASQAILGNVIASGIAFIVAALLFRAYQPKQLHSIAPVFRTSEWLCGALPLLFVTGAIAILNQTGTFMLGLLVGTDAAGIYNAALRLSLVSAFPAAATVTIVTPLISELHVLNRQDDLQKMLKSVAIGVSAVTGVIGVATIVLGEWLLSWFGADFKGAYSSLSILTAGQMINSLSGPVGYLLMQTGNQRNAAMILGMGAAFNIVLNLFLIPVFGLVGAALATMLAASAWNITMVLHAHRQLGLNTTVFSLPRR